MPSQDQLFYKRDKQRQERKSKELKSRQETWLIVTEGTETEPNYFNGLYNYLTLTYQSKLNIKFEPKGCGRNTISLVEHVDHFFDFTDDLVRSARIRYGKTFVVFDKDSFGNSQFDNAIFKSKQKGYIPLWSNECLELWFLLHFNYLQNAVTRDLYYKSLSDIFSRNYENEMKSSKNIFYDIKDKGGELSKALLFSKKLYDSSCKETSPSKRAPCTTMFRIFDELEKALNINFIDRI